MEFFVVDVWSLNSQIELVVCCLFVEHINVKFVEFLLDSIESPPASDEADAVPDVFVKLMLAFNLHFEIPSDNLVMSAVAGRGTAKTFTEKLMLLFNREGRMWVCLGLIAVLLYSLDGQFVSQ